MAARRNVKESELFRSLLAKNYKKAKLLVRSKIVSGSGKELERINAHRKSYFDACKSLFEEDRIENFKCNRVNFPSITSESLLYFAVALKKPLHVEFLLQRGANPDDTFGCISVLSKAIQLDHLEIVRILVSFRAKIASSLRFAVECRRYEIVKWLLGSGKIDFYPEGAMKFAISQGDVRMVKLFCHHFAKRADVRLPLYYALLCDRYKVAQVLLEFGADPNCKFTTPLEYAIRNDKKIAVDLLIEFKVDLNQRLPNGNSPLHCAISHSRDGVILKKLLKANAYIPPSDVGLTAFEEVCYRRDVKMVKLFIKHGFFEPTGFVFAAKNHLSAELFKYFLNNFPDLDVNIRDRDNCTAIYWETSLRQNCGNIMGLLERGAEVNIVNKYGNYLRFRSELCLSHDCPIRKHFIKLSLLGYRVNEDTLTNSPLLKNMEELGAKDRIEFEREVEKLKTIVISSYPRKTLYSVLLMRLREVVKFANNKILLEIHERNGGDFRKEFPHFGFLLNLNFGKGVRQRALITQAKGCLMQYGLPEVVENDILEYLNKQELKIIIEILCKGKSRFSERIANK